MGVLLLTLHEDFTRLIQVKPALAERIAVYLGTHSLKMKIRAGADH
jgi:hypothetical protein